MIIERYGKCTQDFGNFERMSPQRSGIWVIDGIVSLKVKKLSMEYTQVLQNAERE